MKKILCFGDSNTYGFKPDDFQRYGENERWSGILKQKLAPDYEITEEGCNNRNGFVDSEGGENLTGYKVLPALLKTNPDVVILAIGINDLQKSYNPELEVMESGLDNMVKSVKAQGAECIVIAPPVLDERILNGFFVCQFNTVSIEKSKFLPEIYKAVAAKNGAHYINPNEYVSVSDVDGLHYTAEGHSVIADVFADYILKHF